MELLPLEKSYKTRLESIKLDIAKFWGQKTLNHFTMQDVQHSERIHKKLEQLAVEIPEKSQLSQEEIYIASAATYLFEIGMQSYTLENPPLSFNANIGDNLTFSQLEEIRDKKHLLSQQMIQSYLKYPNYKGISLGIVNDGFAPLIAEVCGFCSDNINLESVIEIIPVYGSPVRIRLLVAFLRLADQMYIDTSRVRFDLLQEARDQDAISKEQYATWGIYNYAQMLPISKGQFHFYYSLPPYLEKHQEHIRKLLEPKFEENKNPILQYLHQEFDVRLNLSKSSIIHIDQANTFNPDIGSRLKFYFENETPPSKEQKKPQHRGKARDASECDFEITFLKIKEQTYIQVSRSILDQSHPIEFHRPYSDEAWNTIQKGLRVPCGFHSANTFTYDQWNVFVEQGVAGMMDGSTDKENGYFLYDSIYTVVGTALYRCLFPEEVEHLYNATLVDTLRQGKTLVLRLIFSDRTSLEAMYPWELLCGKDGEFPIQTGAVDLIRYVNMPRPLVNYGEVKLPLKVLFAAARPIDQINLPPLLEQESILKGLYMGFTEGFVEFEKLTPPTREKLIETLQNKNFDVVHFDCHGAFGYWCPQCNRLRGAFSTACLKCGYLFKRESPKGYLILEDEAIQSEYVSAETIKTAFGRSKTRLVVLSACQSSRVDGDDIFSAVSTSLVKVGVPAVIGMQLPITVLDAALFVKHLYQQWGITHSIVDAVGRARQQLVNDQANPKTWFIPTLYLRS